MVMGKKPPHIYNYILNAVIKRTSEKNMKKKFPQLEERERKKNFFHMCIFLV